MAMQTKAGPHGMNGAGPKKEPMDPRLEVANEVKQHLLGLALTHKKMVAGMAAKKKPKAAGIKPEGSPEEEAGESASYEDGEGC